MLEPDTCGECRRAIGLDSVEGSNMEWIDWIRGRARLIATRQGHVHTGELRRVAAFHDWEPEHPNAWGAVFRGGEWEPIGLVKNETPSAHARRIFRWKLKD